MIKPKRLKRGDKVATVSLSWGGAGDKNSINGRAKLMLNLGSTYLIVKDMKKSISFYEKLLEMKVSSQNYDRWAQFNFGGNCIALWNPQY